MNNQSHPRRALLVLAVVLVSLLAVSAMVFAAPVQVFEETDGVEQASAEYSHRLIVQLQSPSLSELSTVPMLANGRIDLAAPDAQAYVAQLQAEQAAFVSAMQQALPQSAVSTYLNEAGQEIEAAYQIAFNGVAVDPGNVSMAEARRALEAMPEVKAVFHDYRYTPDLYASTELINAPALWSQLGGREDAGSGIKLASMDGGLHHEAPMFDGTGWTYPAGWPEGGLGDEANNNGKIIASRAYFRTWDPPAPGDENTWPGENGTSHGTHTGSTAAGNVVTDATYAATDLPTLSGVAPGAWVMSYRMFYNSVSNDGSFYTAEGLAALEDIVADGADVLNNSWGGGPGSVGGEFDPLDQALINAVNAGVFVSMSAGNAGPGLGTGDHPSPDYINVAASTTDGTYATGQLGIAEPTPVPTDVTDMAFTLSTFGGSFPFGQVFSYTFAAAANVDAANFEGCDPWPAGTFDGMAAVISRGSCEFGVKVLNAEQAGADFVVVHNVAAEGDTLISMAPGAVGNLVTIPSVFVGYSDGVDLTSWHTTNGASSVLEVSTIGRQIGNTPDIIANFSSRGPNVGNVLKPDIAAPGVNIMAQGYTPGASGEARHLGFGQASGTSMAAPHVAGAAALVRQAHPDWSVAEIKSALMSTSQYMDIYNGDGTPAQPLDMGAGRLDLTNVTDPGVILDPPSLSFGQMVTGTEHVIEVNVTSVADASETYSLTTLYTGDSFTMTTSLPGFTVSPASITLDPGESTTISVTFDSATGMGIGDNQGYIIMDGAAYDAHMPAWARVTPPASGDVLVIDNDASYTLGFPDYRGYYTETLEALGVSYDVWHADLYFANPVSLPSAAELSQYKAIIYYTGDNFYPDGSFTVATPLTALDMDILTEYANGGGIIIAMGQDLAAVLDSLTESTASFFYDSVLGGEYLQDSITGFTLPDDPVSPIAGAPPAFDGVSLDLSGPSLETVTLSGANEVPPVATTMGGEASAGYNLATGELSYFVTVNVSNPVTITASHIHTGTAGVNGGVLHPLFAGPEYVTDTLSFSGSVTLSADEAAALMSGGLYYNVHTTDNPGGEVRAQVAAALNGDGAGNQWYVDEIASNDPEPDTIAGDPHPYAALFQYPSPYAIQEGIVAMSHRDQPSLEHPGISYLGRSIYTTFGLEGVNDGLGSTSRAELLGMLLDWGMDEPTVTISDVTHLYDDTGQQAIFEASVSSNITGTTGATYRWDFGDGTPYAGPYTSSTAGHDYDYCGTYTVRVEATDSWGNVTIGSMDFEVTQTCTYRVLMPLVFNNYMDEPAPLP
jgi:subtilisin family serine protease